MSIAPRRSRAAIHRAEICTIVYVIILHLPPVNVNVPAVHFYEPLHLLKPPSFFVSQGGFCRVLKIFPQICHKVLTFAENRTIMKTTFFEIEKSCLRSVGIRRKGAAARAP